MITIIATIRPEHLKNIRAGLKSIEIRKTVPKEIPFRVLCCESGSGGRITCEFTVADVKKDIGSRERRQNAYALAPYMSERACVPWSWICEYAGDKPFYAWFISGVVDYCGTQGNQTHHISEFGLKRPPQSWCYVKEESLQWAKM